MTSEALASPCCALLALHGTWYQWNYFLSMWVKLEIWKKTRAEEGWGDEQQLIGEDSLESPGSSESCLTACIRSDRSLPQIKTERLRRRQAKHRSFPPVMGSSDKAQLVQSKQRGKVTLWAEVPCQKSKEGFLFLSGPLLPLVARPSKTAGKQNFQMFAYLSVHSDLGSTYS